MGYTNSRSTMKWWDPHTKKLKYCSSAKSDEHKNKFGKGWSPRSEIILRTNISTLLELKIDLSDHPFIKGCIFESNVNFPKGYTPIGIDAKYCEHNKMSYISHSRNNSPWNHSFQEINSTNVFILVISRK